MAVPALMGVGIGMQALGMFQQGQAAAAEARAQQQVAQYNAKVAEREAQAIEQKTAFEQQRQAEEAARIEGSLRANLGASGAVPSEGTPLMLQSKQAAESELDNLMIGYEGQIGAGRARSQSRLDKMQAGIYSQKASNARTAGMIGAGTTLLTGFGKMAYDQWGVK